MKITLEELVTILADIDNTDLANMFLCNMSPIFKRLWSDPVMKGFIRSLAQEFLSASPLGKTNVIKTGPYNDCLFYESKDERLSRNYYFEIQRQRREVRRGFIVWLINRTAKYFTDKTTGKVWRRNGKTKTWKRSSERFQVPVKSGLYEYGYINEQNINQYNLS